MYSTDVTVQKNVEAQIDTTYTQIHYRSLFWLDTGTSIKK